MNSTEVTCRHVELRGTEVVFIQRFEESSTEKKDINCHYFSKDSQSLNESIIIQRFTTNYFLRFCFKNYPICQRIKEFFGALSLKHSTACDQIACQVGFGE